jgi:RNA polymerase sigma factor (sigma-70 family)
VSGSLQELDSLKLVSRCAQDTQNTLLWTEFVRRFTPKIKQFISGTLRQSLGVGKWLREASVLRGGASENDLFQNTIIRLVENDCAALKRFSGTSENEFLAYLAVISRSVVRDFLRRQVALKRPLSMAQGPRRESAETPSPPGLRADALQVERGILAREVAQLSERTIRSLSGESSERDWLIFQLYYYDDLTICQIAQCKGIGLTKAGVERVIARYKERVRTIVSVDDSEAAVR